MQPDYTNAAIKATETLIKYGVNSMPVEPLEILNQIPEVKVVSYETVSSETEKERNCVMSVFGTGNQDAFTTVNIRNGKPQYIITYNKHLPRYLTNRALARELGHIVIGHDGSLPEKVRNEEAKCFTHHLLCPRPLIFSLQALCVRITTEVLANLTGCNDYCLACMRELPAVSVPPEMNRTVRDQFMNCIMNFFNFQRQARLKDESALAYLGTYMNGYEE